ncbi:MAG: disulfide bond formation protein B [Rhizobiaceae bacterium]|nr:disulfide bond formation protein B [Rhizobiaceae bacterium]
MQTETPYLKAAIFLAFAMALTVLTALGFQHIGGYIPCKLCYEQRTPFYVGAPLMALAALGAWLRWPAALTRALLFLGALIMAYSFYLGAKHAGVEWGWWPGPTDCGAVAPVDTGGKGVLDAINTVVPPSCDKAALRIFGLSFAGWNAVVSFVLMLVAGWAALKRT